MCECVDSPQVSVVPPVSSPCCVCVCECVDSVTLCLSVSVSVRPSIVYYRVCVRVRVCVYR